MSTEIGALRRRGPGRRTIELAAQEAALAITSEPRRRHEIVTTVVDDRAQTVRCACGASAMFGRERDYYGAPVKRARAIAEFVCTGEAITLRAHLIREAE